jgi:hypothetical protein
VRGQHPQRTGMAEGAQLPTSTAHAPRPTASSDQQHAPATAPPVVPPVTPPVVPSTSGAAEMVATQRPEAQPFPWDIASTVALLGVAVAAAMVVWQHRSATRSQLKLGLFQSLTSHIQEATDAASKLSSYIRAIPLDFATARAGHELGSPFAPMARMPRLLETSQSLHGGRASCVRAD